VTTENPSELVHESGTRFHPSGDVLPVDTPHIFQGFLETSNVNPVLEITRMIEVQRAYEAGQSFLDKEDARIRAVIETLGR
jgi:flagellar basal-body rod protein FlgF